MLEATERYTEGGRGGTGTRLRVRPDGGNGVTQAGRWSADELARRALPERGIAIAVNMRRRDALIAQAKERGLSVRIDRATPWGNPFVLGRDGDRPTAIARYRDDYLPFRRDLLGRPGELRGRVLGCRCASEPWHADVLIRELERRGLRRSAPPRNARWVTIERRY